MTYRREDSSKVYNAFRCASAIGQHECHQNWLVSIDSYSTNWMFSLDRWYSICRGSEAIRSYQHYQFSCRTWSSITGHTNTNTDADKNKHLSVTWRCQHSAPSVLVAFPTHSKRAKIYEKILHFNVLKYSIFFNQIIVYRFLFVCIRFVGAHAH